MLQKMAFVAVVTSAFWMNAASALGLGDIDVKSRLNQKFSGSIPLTSIGPDEADSLLINLASNEDFARAGIERSEYVSTLRFSLDNSSATPRIVVTSAQLAREPFISFMVDVRGKSGRILREYTILLDPQEMPVKAAEPVAAKPAVRPAPAVATPAKASKFYETEEEASKPSAPVAAKPEPVKPVAAVPVPAAVANAVSGQYGPIAPKETLWSVATKLRADPSLSMDQVLLAIYNANPSAFTGGISGLQKGAMLQVPTLESQKAVSAQQAKIKLAQLRGQKASPAVELVAPKSSIKPVQPPAEAPVKIVPPAAVAPSPAAPAKPAKSEVAAVSPAASAAVDKKPAVAPTPAKSAEAVSLAPKPAEPVVSKPTDTPVVEAPVATTPPAATETASAAPVISAKPESAEPAPAPADEPPVSSLPPIPPQSTTESDEDTGEMDAQLPLLGILAMALLAAIGGLLYYRKKKAVVGPGGKKPTPQLTPTTASKASATAAAASAAIAVAPKVQATTVSSSQSVKSELEKLSDTLNQETAAAATTAAARNLDSTFAMTAQMPTAAPTSSGVDFNATQAIESPAASTARIADRVDFDVTSQFAAETMSINLDAGDPISEAEFHLAYGLYDEAALLLSQAAEAEPARTDLRVKLAEVYFAASKSVEFQETAEGLKAELPSAEWQKLAIMGQQLCPDSALFQGSAGADLTDAVDLSFDEPVAPAADATQVSLPDIQPSSGNAMDFTLADVQLPDAQPTPAASSGNALDFKLEVPDIQVEPLSLDTGKSAEAAANLIDIDSQHFDLTSSFDAPEKSAPVVAAGNSIDLDVGGEIKLDDFDLGSDSTLSSGDEAGTKLDLARAYLDMGDNEMARGLLNEVKQQGSDQQKSEAEVLIARLGS